MPAAISVVLVWLFHFPIFPAAPFLEYDPTIIPIAIGAFGGNPSHAGHIPFAGAARKRP